MKRLPIMSTLIVALAVAVMIALGVWQLQRAVWKDDLLARYAANAKASPRSFPELGPVPEDAMFRRSSIMCLRVAGWRAEGGRSVAGRPGTRHIAQCITGAEGPGALVDMGVSSDPRLTPDWAGGPVEGIVTTEPNRSSLIGGLFGRQPVLRPMLVASKPAPGLVASAPPSVEAIANNHRAYAVQWFLFAAVALAIYTLALMRRKSN